MIATCAGFIVAVKCLHVLIHRMKWSNENQKSTDNQCKSNDVVFCFRIHDGERINQSFMVTSTQTGIKNREKKDLVHE